LSYTHVETWFCCQNTPEKGAFILAASNAGPITYFLVAALWDAYWTATGAADASLRRQIMEDNWGMTRGEFPPDDPAAIAVLFLDPTIWDEIRDYYLSPAGMCADPCKVLTFIP
jgi:hypothetical protein